MVIVCIFQILPSLSSTDTDVFHGVPLARTVAAAAGPAGPEVHITFRDLINQVSTTTTYYLQMVPDAPGSDDDGVITYK